MIDFFVTIGVPGTLLLLMREDEMSRGHSGWAWD